MSDSGGWKVTLPCTRAEAEAIPFADEAFADLDTPPTLLTDEPDPARPDDWLLHAYFADRPEPAWLDRLTALAPSRRAEPLVEALPPTDWVTLSQAGLEPVRAGRFFVATSEHAGQRRPGDTALVIDAGLASAPANTRRPPVACVHWTSWRAITASTTSSMSAPAPASSPSRPRGPGGGHGSPPATSTRSQSTSPGQMLG